MMKTAYSTLLLSFIFVIQVNGDIPPDSKKIYHDISAGRGLYSGFDKIAALNATNFRNVIFNNSLNNAWLIEFYNSWCGHCHRFAPIWKQFALDIYRWKDVISIGAVDCSNPINTPLCRDFEIMHYPLVKYFPPLPANDFLGTQIKLGNVDQLVKVTLQLLRDEAAESTINRPSLVPIKEKSLDKIWQTFPTDVQHAVFTVQNNESFIGEGLVLDLMNIPSIKVLIVSDKNLDLVNKLGTKEFPTVYVLDKNNHLTSIKPDNHSHITVYSNVRNLLLHKGVEVPEISTEKVPPEAVVDVSQIMAVMQIEESIKKKLNQQDISDIIFQVDIENAMRHSLRVEIPSHKIITGESFTALKLYLEALIEFFPFGKKGIDYLHSIMFQIKDNTSVSGSEFSNIVTTKEELYSPFLAPGSSYIGCRGSEPRYRGYPCGLWSMFHTLTVHADEARTPETKKVLRGMLGYIKNFFGCTDCSTHFQNMAVTMEGNVSTTEESILWLWKAHNNVNNRLAKDSTEDPKHPKVQFPPPNICRACQYNNGSWNEPVVSAFLKNMYKNISYFIMEEIPVEITEKPLIVSALRHENIGEEKGFNYSTTDNKKTLLNFNILDVSLCVILYLFSMAIIVLVCIKFLFKKSYRKKPYPYDIFQKV